MPVLRVIDLDRRKPESFDDRAPQTMGERMFDAWVAFEAAR